MMKFLLEQKSPITRWFNMNYEEAKKEFITTIESYDYRYRKWEIFTDFCKMSAISLYQPFARDEDLEKEYLQILAKYDKKDVDIFPKLFSLIVVALSDRMGDFLGECFTALDLSSKYKGQFFTPYDISKFMASILGDNSREHEGLSEPACGAGGMIIARADVLMKSGVNYQQVMEVQAVDIDSLCVNMCYIQLSLLHISAEVIHGNSLTLEVFKTWYTPAYIMNATKRQVSNFEELKEDIKVKVPNDSNENKILYSDEELEVFSTGKLFA
ncbi:MAG TPA: SAM-dependent DNA methyltransferase [Campylobacterales bacterium]|nr:SAM-dependent DNA methyltransferase [Campylobacterales bacterium]